MTWTLIKQLYVGTLLILPVFGQECPGIHDRHNCRQYIDEHRHEGCDSHNFRFAWSYCCHGLVEAGCKRPKTNALQETVRRYRTNTDRRARTLNLQAQSNTGRRPELIRQQLPRPSLRPFRPGPQLTAIARAGLRPANIVTRTRPSAGFKPAPTRPSAGPSTAPTRPSVSPRLAPTTRASFRPEPSQTSSAMPTWREKLIELRLNKHKKTPAVQRAPKTPPSPTTRSTTQRPLRRPNRPNKPPVRDLTLFRSRTGSRSNQKSSTSTTTTTSKPTRTEKTTESDESHEDSYYNYEYEYENPDSTF